MHCYSSTNSNIANYNFHQIHFNENPKQPALSAHLNIEMLTCRCFIAKVVIIKFKLFQKMMS